MPQQIWKLASSIRAVNRAIIVHDQRAVAVIDLQAAVRTAAHVVVATS
jgi:hypothetical protein